MADNDVQFSTGNTNTLLAIALVAATISLALNFYNIWRTNDVATALAVQTIRSVVADRNAK